MMSIAKKNIYTEFDLLVFIKGGLIIKHEQNLCV